MQFSKTHAKIIQGPRPLHHTFDPTSKVNRAMMRRRRTLTPVARKAQRLAKVYSMPTMRRRAILWLITRWRNA